MTEFSDDTCRRIADVLSQSDSDVVEDKLVVSPELTDLLGEDSVENVILEQLLGRGASGFVVGGTQVKPVRRRVAVKILRRGIDGSRVLARFEAERQALARLEGCNVPTVYSAGLTKLGRPYVCTQFIDGLPITKWCDAHQLDVTQRVLLVIEVCKTLQQTHDAGIVHRDLKPANIMVNDTADGPRVMLIDFGVAKAVGEPLSSKPLTTLDGEFLGTPEYMSPEQAKSAANVDHRTDLWAIGILLYRLCCGREPFQRKSKDPTSLGKLIDSICEGEAPSIGGSHKLELLRPIILRCLEKNPEKRYSDANDLASELERVLVTKEKKGSGGRVVAVVFLLLIVIVFSIMKSRVLVPTGGFEEIAKVSFVFDGKTSYVLREGVPKNLTGTSITFKIKVPPLSKDKATQRILQKRLGTWTGIDVWLWSDVEQPELTGRICLLFKDEKGVIEQVTGSSIIDDGNWRSVEICLTPTNSGLPRGIIRVDGKLDGVIEGESLGSISNDAELILGDGSAQGSGHFFSGEINDFKIIKHTHSWWVDFAAKFDKTH